MKKILINVLTTTAILNFTQTGFAQEPFSIAWQKVYGGNHIERNDYMGKTIAPATDGGYLSTANTYSTNLPEYHGDGDILATKLNSSGTILWQRCYGGSAHDELHSVINTADGGFLIMATTSSADGDVNAFNHGNDDVWLLKIDANGTIQWSKCYGGSQQEIYVTGLQNTDGTFMITTSTASNDGDVHGNHGGYDGLLLKLNTNGNLLWRKCFGGTGDEYVDGLAIIKAQGGGFFLCFNTYSNDGDLATAGFHTGFDAFEGDAWLIRINDNGNIRWSKCYGGVGDDWFRYITQFSNGDVIATGFTIGSDATGDMPGTHGDYDWWVARISSNGTLISSRQYGGSHQEAIHNQAFEYPNGEILLPSGTNSNDGDVTSNTASKALWIVKTDPDGNIIGYNVIGSVGYNQFAGGILNPDGSLVINGMVDPTNLEGFAETVDENANVWTLKLVPNPLTKNDAQFYYAANGKPDDICTNKPSIKLNLRITIPPGYVGPAGIVVQYFKNNNLLTQLNIGEGGYTGNQGKSVYSNLVVPNNTSLGNGSYKAKVLYSFNATNSNFTSKNLQSNNINISFSGGCLTSSTHKLPATELAILESGHQLNSFPNPFAQSTTISFSVRTTGKFSIKVFDIAGRLVKTLVNEPLQQGDHRIKWDGRGANGSEVLPGNYLLRMESANYSATQKIVVIK